MLMFGVLPIVGDGNSLFRSVSLRLQTFFKKLLTILLVNGSYTRNSNEYKPIMNVSNLLPECLLRVHREDSHVINKYDQIGLKTRTTPMFVASILLNVQFLYVCKYSLGNKDNKKDFVKTEGVSTAFEYRKATWLVLD